ncbi:MAG: metal ABC transporter substrate-binding protein [Candidatus Nanopelagicales bacterium]
MSRPLVTLAAAGLVLTGCTATNSGGGADGLPVVTSHYPVEFLVEQVGGDLVDVQTLTAPGTEPHDLELSPQQVAEVDQAAALFYIADFQPAVDEVVGEAGGEVVDVSQGLPLRTAASTDGQGGTDPHVWLDPVLMQQMATTVADGLAQADPEHAEQYQDNARALQAKLTDLDGQWRKGTRDCRIRTMVVSHEAFGYLANQYGFDQKGIAGLSPETEPSASAIAELASFVRDNGVTTVYTEALVDPSVAETVAQEAGAQTAVLDPLEGPPAQGDYLSGMRENLQTVRDGQSCV